MPGPHPSPRVTVPTPCRLLLTPSASIPTPAGASPATLTPPRPLPAPAPTPRPTRCRGGSTREGCHGTPATTETEPSGKHTLRDQGSSRRARVASGGSQGGEDRVGPAREEEEEEARRKEARGRRPRLVVGNPELLGRRPARGMGRAGPCERGEGGTGKT